jgi:uncharacterized protein YbjT (DUF2867 family)
MSPAPAGENYRISIPVDRVIGTTGATGQVGGRLARRLAARAIPQRLIVRDRSTAPDVPGSEVMITRDHFHTEEHIRDSGVAFTFSRQNLYMDLLPLIGGEQS